MSKKIRIIIYIAAFVVIILIAITMWLLEQKNKKEQAEKARYQVCEIYSRKVADQVYLDCMKKIDNDEECQMQSGVTAFNSVINFEPEDCAQALESLNKNKAYPLSNIDEVYISEQILLTKELDEKKCKVNFQPACCLLDNFYSGEIVSPKKYVYIKHNSRAVAERLLVSFDDGLTAEDKLRVMQKYGGVLIGCTSGIMQVEFKGATPEDLGQIISMLEKEIGVKFAQFSTANISPISPL